MSLERIHALLGSHGARRLSTAHPIHELRRPFWPFGARARRFSLIQAELLDAIRELPWQPFLVYAEDPGDWDLTGSWQRVGPSTWTPPRETSSRSLLDDFLEPGAWRLYLAASAVDEAAIPDLFRAPLDEIVAFGMSRSVPILLDAWHDNTDWRVLVEPSAVPGMVAA